MGLIPDYINKNNSQDNKFLDPIYKTPLDLFNICIENKPYQPDIFDIIQKKDYTELVNLTSYDLNKLKRCEFNLKRLLTV